MSVFKPNVEIYDNESTDLYVKVWEDKSKAVAKNIDVATFTARLYISDVEVANCDAAVSKGTVAIPLVIPYTGSYANGVKVTLATAKLVGLAPNRAILRVIMTIGAVAKVIMEAGLSLKESA